MATYLKRTSKLFDLTLTASQSLNENGEINLRDLMCPVCRGILIEPVTLPCTHNLCLRCLKGNFKHNSLSCPLCRVRVGSWLRNASKSESLVNNDLWEHIRSRFPQEIEGKSIDDQDINGQDGYVPQLLSAPGEIRREYEFQLQKASEEMRKQRENERIANEEFIRKLHQEEKNQKLAQLAQDQLLARSLAKKQLMDKEKTLKCHNDYLRNSPARDSRISNLPTSNDRLSTTFEQQTEATFSRQGVILKDKLTLDSQKDNFNFNSKVQSSGASGDGSKASMVSINPNNQSNNRSNNKSLEFKACCDHSGPFQGFAVAKSQGLMLQKGHLGSYNFQTQPSCSSTSKIYNQTKDDHLKGHLSAKYIDSLISSKKGDIEVHDDKRIESPASAGSHDSINPEIHHFKPIKALPRTPLKVTQDGKADLKVVRVVPLLKRIFNPVLKAPASGSIKRLTGCTWSAFKGKAQGKQLKAKSDSKSFENSPPADTTTSKIDLPIHFACDTNKNYTKNPSRLVNGTKTSKISASHDETDAAKLNKSQVNVKNGALNSCRSSRSRKRNNIKEITNDSHDNRHTFMNFLTANTKNTENNSHSMAMCSKNLIMKQTNEIDDHNCQLGALENIAERIKRRKLAAEYNKKDNCPNSSINKQIKSKNCSRKSPAAVHTVIDDKKSIKNKRKGISEDPLDTKRPNIDPNNIPEGHLDCLAANDDLSVNKSIKRKNLNKKISLAINYVIDEKKSIKNKRKNHSKGTANFKRANIDPGNDPEGLDKCLEINTNNKIELSNTKRTKSKNSKKDRFLLDFEADVDGSSDPLTTNKGGLRRNRTKRTRKMKNMDNLSKKQEEVADNGVQNDKDLDKRVIEEQECMQRILLQEKQDYELAQRLQMQFDEMQRISGRTRGSKRALERSAVAVSVEKSDVYDKMSLNEGLAMQGPAKSRRRRYD